VLAQQLTLLDLQLAVQPHGLVYTCQRQMPRAPSTILVTATLLARRKFGPSVFAVGLLPGSRLKLVSSGWTTLSSTVGYQTTHHGCPPGHTAAVEAT